MMVKHKNISYKNTHQKSLLLQASIADAIASSKRMLNVVMSRHRNLKSSIYAPGWIPPHQCKSFEQDAVYAWPPGENQCTMVNVEVTDNGVPTNVTRPCAHGWVYNTNYHTISTEVGQRKYLCY